MHHLSRLVCAAALGGVAYAQTPTILLLNEVRIDQSGADNDEYFELIGAPPSASLNDVTYVVIGDGTGGSGVIEAVVSLAGQSLAGTGLFLAAESTFSFPVPFYNAGATTLNFENGDNVTHLVVGGFTGVNGQDLDTNDDGVLDLTPWTTLYDAVSLVQSTTSGDRYYGAALGGVDVGPDGTFVPGHVYRCLTSLTDLRIGPFGASSPITSDPTVVDTPGTFNAQCVASSNLFCDPGFPNSFSMGGGRMGRTGSGSLQLNDNSLTCSDVPNFFGVFVQATGASGPFASPIGAQFCVDTNIVRMNTIVAPVSNVATLALDFEDPLLVESSTVAGTTMYYQYFHRDTLYAGGGNWSNGIAITWAP